MKFEKEMAIIYFHFGLIMGLESRGVYMRKKRKIQKCRPSHKAMRLRALMKSRTLPIRNSSTSLIRHCISKAVTSGDSIK
jgi:hypothetical protein